MRRRWPFFLCITGAVLSVAAGVLSLFYLVGLGDRAALNDGAVVFDSESPFANVTLVPLRSWRLPWPALLRKAIVPAVHYGPYRDPQRPAGVMHLHARLPLWIPAVLCLLLAPLVRRMQRRSRPGRCACGYDLSGNLSGVCPECGRRVASAFAAAARDVGGAPPH